MWLGGRYMKLTKLLGGALAVSGMALATMMAPAASQAQSVTIRVQSVIPAKADEVHSKRSIL